MPENSLKVDRTTIFGNPFTIEKLEPPRAVELYRSWLMKELSDSDIEKRYPAVVAKHLFARRVAVLNALPKLRGKNLGCWCALPYAGEADVCHASVLLELANR